MAGDIESAFQRLMLEISHMGEVSAVGRCGGARPLPLSPEDGDIDVFVYCSAVPGEQCRRNAIAAAGEDVCCEKIAAISGGRWGTGDLVYVCGAETWLMYMTESEAEAEVDSILSGNEPDRQNNYFYPTGRLGMLLGMEILFDRAGFLHGLKERVAVVPKELAEKLLRYHLDALEDREDLERAVLRKDALFYHFALDLALDHFLQALFARNRVWFPSRKRSLEYIAKFASKPENCEARLLETVRLGGSPEGLAKSYELFAELAGELKN